MFGAGQRLSGAEGGNLFSLGDTERRSRRSRTVYENDPRVLKTIDFLPQDAQSNSAFVFAPTPPIEQSSPPALSPSTTSSSSRSSRNSTSKSVSSPHGRLAQAPPPLPQVTWKADSTWDVDPYKLDDEEVDILGALLPVTAEEPDRKNLFNLAVPPQTRDAQPQPQTHPKSSGVRFAPEKVSHHPRTTSNRSSSSFVPNPTNPPNRPLPPIPVSVSPSKPFPRISVDQTCFPRSSQLSTNSAASNSSKVRQERGENEIEIADLEKILKRIHLASETLLVEPEDKGGSKDSSSVNEIVRVAKVAGEEKETKLVQVDLGEKFESRGTGEKMVGLEEEDVLKLDIADDEDEEDELSNFFFQTSNCPILPPPSGPRGLTPINSASSSHREQSIQYHPIITKPKPYRFSHSSSTSLSSSLHLLVPPSLPPPTKPLPPIPPAALSSHSRQSSTGTNYSKGTVSTAPTSPDRECLPGAYRAEYDD